MKKNIKKILSFVLMLSLLVGMMAGFSVFAAEEETPAVEIVSKNVYYADTLKLMYAVRTNDPGVVLNIYNADGVLVETITNHTTEDVKGADAEVFISSFGVPAQDIDTVFYAEAVLSNGTKTDKVRYSVLEYLYERLTTLADALADEDNTLDEDTKTLYNNQKTMYNNLLAFADSADIVVNKTAADKSIANYAYVRVNNGTVDGTYSNAMLMAGTKLDSLTTDYVVENGKVLVWDTKSYEFGKTPVETVLSADDAAEFAVEAGKVYELTPNSVESGEPIITTVSTTIADYATANGWSNGTKYPTITLDSNVTVTATGADNTGKYYTSGNEWRTYQTETPTITISVPTDKKIVTVKITYNISNSGVLTLNGSNINSNTVLDVNASSVKFSVGNSGSATNGQVKITAIEVVYTDLPAHDCVYSDATCTTPKTCTICGATDGEALGHSYDNGVVTTPATCTEVGVKTFTCTCGNYYTEDIDALGHTVESGFCDRCETEIGGDFCDAFKRELTFQKSALIDFCNKFCDGRKGDIVELIQEYIKDLQSAGQFVRDAEKWTVAHLKKEEKQEIIDFLSGLGKSPTVEQLSLVDKSCQLFQSRQKIALDNEKKKGNMFFKLLVLLGIALMVILV